MDILRLGPVVLPVHALLALLGLGAANAVAAWYRRCRGIDPGPALWRMTLVGFVAGRLFFVLRHHDLFADSPWSALNIRDGGFVPWAGWLAALVTGALLARNSAPLRRSLLAATLAGGAVWLGATLLNQALAPAREPIPAIAVQRLDGATVALDSFKGRPLVINLWATWCGPCRREMPALMAAQRAHPQVTFVFVNQGESAQAVRDFLSGHQLDIANVFVDPARQAGTATRSLGYPTTLFYDAAGTLRLRHVGELSQASAREKIAGLDGPP
ncbi:TlpA disulfide reductase family protein [Massilia sp. YMA4]|uniref:TlpA disulfide reductase family protein n=1 Tax=Massilia sp. YMA4 TaxID=1593482 RepID=UPI000DD13296|nr:TlpA disulfide reductase family protein [Massilia sp. YMA4]AXA94248.1 TlpA family protein disulfide reductase [Massilia sp. YMA4]